MGNAISIATWNVNSARMRLNQILDLMDQVDILLLQEIKCETHKFPINSFTSKGLFIEVKGQKAYNGVAIISKLQMTRTCEHIYGVEAEARYLEVLFHKKVDIRVGNLYCPNGRSIKSEHFLYKMSYYDAFYRRLQEVITNDNEVSVFGGDFNVAPEDIDVYDPVDLSQSIGFYVEERRKLRSLFHLGYYDAFRLVKPETVEYSWWDYRHKGWDKNHGMRIDNFLISPKAADMLYNASILRSFRGKELPSDHVPVICYLDL